MSQHRQPAVAGMFYPGDKITLENDIKSYLSHVESQDIVAPKVIVVPHAGYMYSGPIAASAYKLLIPIKNKIKRVVLLGPSHRVAFCGLAAPNSVTFITPLGSIPIDHSGIDLIADLNQVVISDQAHAAEHSLEVQLPFLQEVLSDFSLVPLVVGDANRYDVAEVIDRLWGGDETLIVISTDLSHYHSYEEARQMDQATSDAIIHLDADAIGYEDACGRNGLQGMLYVAKQRGLKADLLDLRNSGDTAGDKIRVVGYGAYAVH